jgi:hypothetical protein
MNAVLSEVFETPGFSNALTISSDEVECFRLAISRQWLGAIRRDYPQYAEQFEALGIARYHELAHLLDHSRLWNKSNRCLPQEDVQALKKLNFLVDLKKVFGEFALSSVAYDNEIVEDQEEIYWRLVRPHQPGDVGPLHADKWFHEMLGMQGRAMAQDSYTLKVWTPIYCEPGKNGLLIVPDSHKRTWRHSTTLVNGVPKPVFEDQADPVLVSTPPGNMLIFPEETLHGGALNQGDETRVSCEITLVFKHNPARMGAVSA